MSDLSGVLAQALDWHVAGHRVAVATVIETWGSAPRPAGSQMVIREDSHMIGSVSGGCVEGAVIVEALETLDDGAARVLEYGVSDDDAFAVGLACGGRIRVLVEPVGATGAGAMPLGVLQDLVAAITAKEPVAYIANLTTGARDLARGAGHEDRFRLDRSGVEPDGKTFVAIHNPALRMIVVGGVHIAQHLIPMAQACGFDPLLVDPRPAFGSPVRFPDITIRDEWPDAALALAQPDARTAIVTLTHDPKLDDPAIKAALSTPVFYLGCLGSTRTHAKRVERLKDAGFDGDDIARIHAPVGLDIGGRSPAEIAVSIMAQVTQRLRQG